MIVNALLVFIGGALGTIGRWIATDVLVPISAANEWGLLAANLLGAGLLAFLNATVSFRNAIRTSSDCADDIAVAQFRERAMLLFGTGFCGAFTSYSGLSAVIGGAGGATATSTGGYGGAQLYGMGLVGAYFAVTLVGGMLAVFFGLKLGYWFAGHRYGHLTEFDAQNRAQREQK